MTIDVIMGIVRHVLTFGGGFVVSQGWATGSDAETISAGIATAVGVLWSIWQKAHASK